MPERVNRRQKRSGDPGLVVGAALILRYFSKDAKRTDAEQVPVVPAASCKTALPWPFKTVMTPKGQGRNPSMIFPILDVSVLLLPPPLGYLLEASPSRHERSSCTGESCLRGCGNGNSDILGNGATRQHSGLGTRRRSRSESIDTWWSKSMCGLGNCWNLVAYF
jgi:hypothetical protein